MRACFNLALARNPTSYKTKEQCLKIHLSFLIIESQNDSAPDDAHTNWRLKLITGFPTSN
uniref:Uncharacterized protein n=1 Tax=Romanomermis culicivorax TaxID=13658 RepID=A0A915IJL8_ROMCU